MKKNSGYDKSNIIIGIKEFHGMWESILGSVLNDRININNKFAAPVYKISNEYIHASSRGQKTDIVLKINDLYYIIDAKYYRASNANNAPSLPDIIKQFYYVKSMSLIAKEAVEIFSVFVFPGVKGNIESIHMALKDKSTKLDQKDLLDEHYPPIFCLYKDPIRLIHLYANGKKNESRFS